MKFKTIDQAGDLKGKRVLLRLDMNVAIKDGRVADDFRLRKSFPTISFLKERGAKIIMIGHLENAEIKTFAPVYAYFKNYFPLTFIEKITGPEVTEAVSKMADGDMLLLENLRQHKGEKANDPQFAKELASLGEIYVDEAFSAAHREHASIVGIPALLPGYAGFLFRDEVANLSKSFHPEKPFLFILGGAKFDTKIPLVTKFMEIADYVYITGALSNDCFKQKGMNIGASRVSEEFIDLTAVLNSPKVILPKDAVVKNGDTVSVKRIEDISGEDMMWDAGPESVEDLKQLVQKSKFVLWNGTLGNYEAGFEEGTLKLAQAIAQSEATSVLGGGDTLAAIAKLKIEDQFDFVSSAGGAMLDFLAHETLPGIVALEKSEKSWIGKLFSR